MLGIDRETLRRWADARRIEAFTTPGGHRRFSRRSIHRLIAARRSGEPPASLAHLGATAERLSAAYRRSSTAHPAVMPAGVTLDEVAREAVRVDGRGLVDALVRYLDSEDAPTRERIEAEASALARDLAARLAAAGVTLPDAVERFTTARRPLLEELGRVARRRRLEADRLTGIFLDTSAVLDRLLMGFVAAHEAATGARTHSHGR